MTWIENIGKDLMGTKPQEELGHTLSLGGRLEDMGCVQMVSRKESIAQVGPDGFFGLEEDIPEEMAGEESPATGSGDGWDYEAEE